MQRMTHIHAYTLTYIHTYTYLHTHAYIRTFMLTHTHINTCIYTFIYTYIHTQVQELDGKHNAAPGIPPAGKQISVGGWVGGWVGGCVGGWDKCGWVGVSKGLCVCMYVCVFVSVCVRVCVCIDTHTRILKSQFAAQFTIEHDCRPDL